MKIGSKFFNNGFVERYADMNGMYDNYYELVYIDKGGMKETLPNNPSVLGKTIYTKNWIQNPKDNSSYLVIEYLPDILSTERSIIDDAANILGYDWIHKGPKITSIVKYYYRFLKTVNHKIDIELPQ